MVEPPEFHIPPKCSLSMLHPQRRRRGSVTIHGAQSTSDCCPKECHRDARHQGRDRTPSLLQEHFWWPGMAKQMRQVIKTCRCCFQYEGGTPKAPPLCPIVGTTPLDLLHVDFTSIETTMELDKSPRVANVLVFQDHFTKYVLVYVTPIQTAKTIVKFLYGGFISISGALARLLSDRGTSFTSSIIRELCEILGVQ